MEVNFITSNNGYKVQQDQQKKNKEISQSITSESFAAAACNYALPEGRPPHATTHHRKVVRRPPRPFRTCSSSKLADPFRSRSDRAPKCHGCCVELWFGCTVKLGGLIPLSRSGSLIWRKPPWFLEEYVTDAMVTDYWSKYRLRPSWVKNGCSPIETASSLSLISLIFWRMVSPSVSLEEVTWRQQGSPILLVDNNLPIHKIIKFMSARHLKTLQLAYVSQTINQMEINISKFMLQIITYSYFRPESYQIEYILELSGESHKCIINIVILQDKSARYMNI
jgi:hypothetical protein